MSPLLIPMFALLIPIVAIVSSTVIRPWFKLRERQMELNARLVAEKAAQYAAKTDRLEERVRVLERIATDRGADLAHEIEQLRDDRPPAPMPLASRVGN